MERRTKPSRADGVELKNDVALVLTTDEIKYGSAFAVLEALVGLVRVEKWDDGLFEKLFIEAELAL